MSIRAMLTGTLLFTGLACRNPDQGPAEEPQSEPPDEIPGGMRGDTSGAAGSDTAGGMGSHDHNPGGMGTTPGSAPGQGSQATTGQGSADEKGVGVVTRVTEVQCTQASPARRDWATTAPQGAVCRETADAVLIAAGDEFQLVIREAGPDMATRKKAIESDASRKLRRYTMDTPEVIIYELDTGTGKADYNFYATRKVGDLQVTCEGQKGRSYTQPQVEAMLKACQSLTRKQ